MNVQNFNNETVTLTQLESKVVNHLKGCDQYDERFYSEIKDISSSTGIDIKQLRGVLSSLDQKEILYTDHNFFTKGDTIVFLF